MVRICDFQSHDDGFNSLWKCLNSSSSNGRTSDFGSVNRGSNPALYLINNKNMLESHSGRLDEPCKLAENLFSHVSSNLTSSFLVVYRSGQTG